MQQALQLKKYGEANSIDLLQNGSFPFSKQELHIIGLIASGMFDASGYYIADYGQGAMLVTIKSSAVDAKRNDTHYRIPTVFPQLISQFGMNHKAALKAYLLAKGYTVAENKNELTGTKNESKIIGVFDEQSRLLKLNG